MSENLPRISHARGRGQMNHNNRVHVYDNVDSSRTKDNITYVKENLDIAYEKCFGEAQRAYDAKQTREDRKILDYYTHLFGEAPQSSVAISSKGHQSYYEIVVGIGCKDTCPVGSEKGKLATKVLDEYMRGFQERNPNFYVFNSTLHLDENTGHGHLNYFPFATGYKRGMEVQNGHAKALEQMGYGNEKGSIDKWRKQERQIIRELCQKHGLKIAEETRGRGKTFSPNEYKQIKDEVKEELKTDPDIMDEIKDEIREEVVDELLSKHQHIVEKTSKEKQELDRLKKEKSVFQSELDKVQGKRKVLDAVNAYTATPSKLNKDNVVIPATQFNDLKKTAIEGARNTRQQKELREKKNTLDLREKTLNDREGKLTNKEASLDSKLRKANDEARKYKSLYDQEQDSTLSLIVELNQQKGEARRWENNYNSLYAQHVKLKRSKGLEV